ENATGLSSGWIYYDDIEGNDDSDGKSKTFTYPYSHPAPIPNFTFVPENPRPNQQIYFYDSSLCFDKQFRNFACGELKPNKCVDNKCYTWNFGDGTITNTIGSVYYSYSNPNTYVVNLQVCDDFGCCGAEASVPVKSAGFQKWKEISPF
ncbi:MAG: PKD domain-containing protein, partial [bacterium]|nr:PKD domain-containing protein [bacterium]